MENKNSCKENFEMAKTELQDMEAIADFFSNPMIKSGMEMLGELYYRVGGADCKK